MRITAASRALIVALLPLVLGGIANANLYNLSGDWSNTNNPNGVWSYYVNGAPATLGTRGSDAFANPPGAPAIWGDNTANYIGWSKSNGSEINNGWDLQTGDVYGHTPNYGSIEIRWTSPVTGQVEVSGGLWAIRDIGRWNWCELTLNGSPVFSTMVGSGDAYSRSNPIPVSYSADLNAGDVLGFRASPMGTPDYVAANLTIETTPVPLPGAVLLGALGLGAAGWRLKRRTA
jgi:hypothetical protein